MTTKQELCAKILSHCVSLLAPMANDVAGIQEPHNDCLVAISHAINMVAVKDELRIYGEPMVSEKDLKNTLKNIQQFSITYQEK